jgi:manganese/iron transport system permease protein
MLDLIVEPLTYPFMVRGLLAAVLVGSVCAVVGSYVVLRGMAFFGDALAHTVLPGVAVGYLASAGDRGVVFWAGMLTAIASALAIGSIARTTKVREDTAIGIVFAGMFALGVALISTVRSFAVDLTHLMFGDILGVGSADLIRITIFGGIVLLGIVLLYKEFMLLSFDPVLARTLRLPVNTLDNLLLVLIAITVVVAIQTVGVALLLAVLVTPAAAAALVTRRLHVMMLVAALIAALSGVVGLYLSYYLNIASGAAIVLTCTASFLLVWAVQTLRHRFARRRPEAQAAI